MRTQAVILKKIPIREYDELVVCYTDNLGKQIYQAKSVVKATSVQASHLDIFNWVDFSLIKGNGHAIITGAHALRSFANLKSSLPALASGYFLLECFDRLVFEGEADAQLWHFLTKKLEQFDALAKHGYNFWPTVINSTRQELLATMGYDSNAVIEELAGKHFQSLHFARKVIR